MSNREEDSIQRNETNKQNTEEFAVVGIGASAGGLEALQEFFDHLPEASNMAFVIVQHLSPHYKSFMAELLEKHTSLRIKQVTDGMKIEPNFIYLNPPKNYIQLINGHFSLTTYPEVSGIHLPIDAFLESLATEKKQRAIAIILSGTGTDGSNGIKAIHEYGGMVMVQDGESAKFDGMPRNALSTGIVDFICAPFQLGEYLVQYVKRYVLGEREEEKNIAKDRVKDILTLLTRDNGVDFTGYKRDGIIRRIERRMKINNKQSLEEYLQYLEETQEEQGALQKDMLINVTHFFRDQEAFNIVKANVIPKIIENKQANGEQHVRIWVAGCSTGEEAYSLAMLFDEYLCKKEITLDVRIFATDLDKEAINYAAQGVYPASIEKDISKDLLDRYFEKQGDAYHIIKNIRRMIVFAPHNIIKDPPFVNMDFITCRNMMIYFQPDVQKKVLSLFHFALHPKGYLFLGPSESIGKLANLYVPLNRKWNIFAIRKSNQNTPNHTIRIDKESGRPVLQSSPVKIGEREMISGTNKLDDIYATIIEEYLPACVIVDRNYDIVHTSGPVNKYLTLPRGKITLNIFKLVSPSLSVAIGSAMHKVRKKNKEITFTNVKVKEGADLSEFITLSITNFAPHKYNGQYMMITFKDEAKPDKYPEDAQQSFHAQSTTTQRIRELELELQYAQESLQATIEELETSNEELQSTNEELIAANEELQSTNEELQSINEELITVNAEHQAKIQELLDLNNDIDNFLLSTKIGTIFLDRNMCVRRFTPAVTTLINLMDMDINRPISHITHQLKYNNLVEDAEHVLHSVMPLEKEIQSLHGQWYSMEILPYRTQDNVIKGVVITFVDITELKMANKELQKLSYAIHQIPNSIIITDLDGEIQYINPSFTAKTGYTGEEVIGQKLNLIENHEDYEENIQEEIIQTLTKGRNWYGELQSKRKNDEAFWERTAFLPIKNEEGEIIHFLKISEDITQQKKAEELLRKSEMLSAVGQLAAGIAHEIRNPLTALKGFIQLMMADGQGNEKYFQIMMGEFDRIELIITELLLLSKPHALSFQTEDIGIILNDVLMLIETHALMNQVDIIPVIPTPLPKIHCVENQLKQVLINVLKNAIESMPTGGSVDVHVSRKASGKIAIEITDQGKGIPQDKLARVGEPFFTTKEKGTGLGLMVSYKIIENHNGEIQIESELGKGTTVRIILPTVSI
ncbi:CheR family methyltransferase [Brevibacillus laterosporus]|uniref:CheR family methyltransferase n=1 Tax=Brevibacillus laterosporus TaxID=1465 RepID=UPI000839D67A|nr:CheR family methyltransferase [Brevibacillus laterosporus]